MKSRMTSPKPMTFSNLLTSNFSTLVIDNSVLVNLFACEQGVRILRCIPNHILIPDKVIDEFNRKPDELMYKPKFIQQLLEESLVEMKCMDTIYERNLYNRLIDDGISLGDGEAATISIASFNKFIPVIDESKGRKEAAKVMGDVAIPRSTDLLMHSKVFDTLSAQEYADSIFHALQAGHMHVAPEECTSIVNLIGDHRALLCNSLPNYKSLKAEIMTRVRALE